jgi:phage regulator Rha-like protein
MTEIIKFTEVQNKIISFREMQVILDSDVAKLYGVETRDINKSVKNNRNKFPEGYIFELNEQEFENLRWKNSTANFSMTRVNPKAFTEKGLYMLATILKSEKAAQTTIAIVEAFAKLREVSRNLELLNTITPETIETIEPEVINNTSGLLNELLFSGSPTSAETSVELNLLGVAKIKRSVKSESPIKRNEYEELKNMMKEMKQAIDKIQTNSPALPAHT